MGNAEVKMNWPFVFLIIFLLIAADKILTVINIKLTMKDTPENPYGIERNPIAKWSFQKGGLFWGTIIYGVFSFATFLLAMWLMSFATAVWSPTNKWQVAFYIMFIAYSFVLGNNAFFMLKYAKLI